jgi:transposase
MKLYGAIDLHSNNNVTVLIDEQDQVVYQKRLPNELPVIVQQLSGYQAALQGIVVESTYNWYWLVDGLMDQGHKVHLANTAAIQQYEGLKYTDDNSDARWLAHILRLGVLPQGYIYPKEERAVQDLLRKRSQLVHQRTANLLSIQNLVTRNTGSSISANRIKGLDAPEVDELLPMGISPWPSRLTCRSCPALMNRRKSWSAPSGIESSSDQSLLFSRPYR